MRWSMVTLKKSKIILNAKEIKSIQGMSGKCGKEKGFKWKNRGNLDVVGDVSLGLNFRTWYHFLLAIVLWSQVKNPDRWMLHWNLLNMGGHTYGTKWYLFTECNIRVWCYSLVCAECYHKIWHEVPKASVKKRKKKEKEKEKEKI